MKTRILTFNIRCSAAQDGPLGWSYRRDRVVRLLRDADAEVMALQEVWPDQLADLRAAFPEWAWMAHNRGDQEMAAQAWRPDRWVLQEASAWMLAPAGAVWGTKGWDSACPRMAGLVELARDGSLDGPRLTLVNTHFDHEGPVARRSSPERILDELARRGRQTSAVIVGDFNAELGDPALAPLVAFGHGSGQAELPRPTFRGFGTDETPVTIDHVFTGASWRVVSLTSRWVEPEPASDHDLVLADLEWSDAGG